MSVPFCWIYVVVYLYCPAPLLKHCILSKFGFDFWITLEVIAQYTNTHIAKKKKLLQTVVFWAAIINIKSDQRTLTNSFRNKIVSTKRDQLL